MSSIDLVEFLTSDAARRVLEEFVPASFDAARDVPRLRRTFDREQTAALADMLIARPLARTKFGPHADRMVYSVEAVQQATPWQVAGHRSRRFSTTGTRADLGCGIGGDAMWLGPRLVGLDLDRDRLAMARHNAAVAGVDLLAVRADLESFPGFTVDEAFADPGRRAADGRRIFDVERYRPPLSVLLRHWRDQVGGMAVKVHPGVDVGTLPDEAEVEFVSLDGDLKEACLWLDSLQEHAGTSATVLPSGVSLTGQALAVRPDVGDVGEWLFEPDAAVIRAGLVGDVAAVMDLRAIDPSIAYITGSAPIDSPLLTGYQVTEVMPFNGKRIKAYLRERDVGSVTIKKRGSPIDPQQFRKSLDLSGDERCVVILTRAAGRPVAIIAEEQASAACGEQV
jgi:hypothetical protein